MDLPTTRPVLFYFDYVDPVSYVLYETLKGRGWSEGVSFRMEPFEISPPPHPLLDPGEAPWASLWLDAEEPAGKVGLALRRPRLVPWTRKAHELAFLAKERGRFPQVFEALFRAFFLEGRDIGRVDILVEIAAGAGLDPMETKAALDVDRYREEVEAARLMALGAGIRRTPTLVKGSQRLEGLPKPETLWEFFSTDTD